MMRLSTPDQDLLGSVRRPVFALALSMGMLLLCPQAMAMECSDADKAGACLDAGTFEWCEDGEMKSAKCPDGQICVADNPFYDGAGCVATDETACGEISAEGECTTANGVVWCDEGVPMVFPCGEDSVCGWDEQHGEYDCLPRSNVTSEADAQASDDFGTTADASGEDEDASGEDTESGPEPDSQDFGAENGSENPESRPETGADDSAQQPMSPSVTPTDTSSMVDSAEDKESEQGCQAGHAPGGLLWIMFSTTIWLMARRRAGSLSIA